MAYLLHAIFSDYCQKNTLINFGGSIYYHQDARFSRNSSGHWKQSGRPAFQKSAISSNPAYRTTGTAGTTGDARFRQESCGFPLNPAYRTAVAMGRAAPYPGPQPCGAAPCGASGAPGSSFRDRPCRRLVGGHAAGSFSGVA